MKIRAKFYNKTPFFGVYSYSARPSIDPCSDQNNRETPWGSPHNNLDLQRVQSDKVICFTSIGTCQMLKLDGAHLPPIPLKDNKDISVILAGI